MTSDEDLVRAALAVADARRDRRRADRRVVLSPDGAELARACNAREALGDPTAHAEVLALREAATPPSATAGA